MTPDISFMDGPAIRPKAWHIQRRKTYLRRTAYAVAGVVMALAAWQAWGVIWAL